MRTFLNLFFTSIFCLIIISNNDAQSEKMPDDKSFELGLEIQAYPTGIIPGIRFEKYLNSSSSLNFRLGYQLIDHRDLGVQNNEDGSGYGASIAYRRFFKSNHKGLSLAFRTDLWFNKIDWENDSGIGTSNITVIQPSLMGEYALRVSDGFSITPSLSFGWEWNVTTDGIPTGEGAIILLGCAFGFGI